MGVKIFICPHERAFRLGYCCMVMVMVMVNVDLYSAIITKVSNALDYLYGDYLYKAGCAAAMRPAAELLGHLLLISHCFLEA